MFAIVTGELSVRNRCVWSYSAAPICIDCSYGI